MINIGFIKNKIYKEDTMYFSFIILINICIFEIKIYKNVIYSP